MPRHSTEFSISCFFWPFISLGRKEVVLLSEGSQDKCTPCKQSCMSLKPQLSWPVVSSRIAKYLSSVFGGVAYNIQVRLMYGIIIIFAVYPSL